MGYISMDTYINEVTKNMNVKQREEVSKELRSHILDSAESLAAERNVPVNEGIIIEVISRMGPPGKIAAMYPHGSSILKESGLARIAKVLLSLLLALVIVVVILAMVSPDLGLPMHLIALVATSMLMAMGVIAAILTTIYVYETTVKTSFETRFRKAEKMLNEASSPVRIAFGVFFTALGLAVINLFWKVIPFISGFNESVTLIPLFTDSFAMFLPYINILGVATILTLVLYLIFPFKWVPSAIEVLLALANAFLIIWVLIEFPFNPAFSAGVMIMIKVVLALAIIGTLVDVAKKIWQTIRFALFNKYEKFEAVN